jgi:hypothetical protein
LDPTVSHKSTISDLVEGFHKKTEKFYSIWIDEDRLRDAEHNADPEDQRYWREYRLMLMKSNKYTWFYYVIDIERSLEWLKPIEEKEITKKILLNVYKLIFNSMIELQKLQIFSETEISILLNQKTNGRLISDYAITEFAHSKTSKGIDPWNVEIKQALEDIFNDVEGFPELLKCK